ncbi:MAG: hypothetical protein R3F60_18630 [bacterium]
MALDGGVPCVFQDGLQHTLPTAIAVDEALIVDGTAFATTEDEVAVG